MAHGLAEVVVEEVEAGVGVSTDVDDSLNFFALFLRPCELYIAHDMVT